VVSTSADAGQSRLPLVVDLDGTIVATDTLLESALRLIRRQPWLIGRLAAWLTRGRAVLKAETASRSNLDPACLPYRTEVIEYLRTARAGGRKVVLATAANRSIAENVAAHLDVFDEVLASSRTLNLKGRAKRDELVKAFSYKGFDYIGNSDSDIPVWEASSTGHVAGAMRRLPDAARSSGTREGRVFAGPRAGIAAWLREIRVYQWVKNLLVFVPALLNHRIDGGILKNLTITFLGFSFIASGAYITNDLCDLDSDRKHPRKCRRPLAAGEISIARGVAAAVCLLAGGFSVAALAGLPLVACLAAYLAVTFLYSAFVKGKPILDVVTLAMLYTLRVYTGGIVSKAYISPWCFQFSIFLFLSLAFVKRYSELRRLRWQHQDAAPGRNYRLRDLGIVSQAGIGSGLLAGLVLALYLNGGEIQRLYPHPQMLWAVCPLFIYWIVRVWLVAHRGNMYDDPLVFAFRDRVSYIVGALILGAVLLGMAPDV
jgi:4-hydroxybenzoate polyprenyltransferase/phosphoserine phosphatase